MRIYALAAPEQRGYASFDCSSSWCFPDEDSDCPECGIGKPPKRLLPLQIEWRKGSDEIGDFSWDIYDESVVVVRRSLVKRLGSAARCLKTPGIEMYQSPGVRTPRDRSRARQRRVWLPYQGPELVEIVAGRYLQLDHSRSTVKTERRCDACGSTKTLVEGIEYKTVVWDKKRMTGWKRRVRRKPGKGAYLMGTRRAIPLLFRVKELPSCVLCTEDTKSLLEQIEATNVEFREVGEIITS